VAVNFTEHALSFACAGEELLGIVTAPEQPKPIGVLIAVGGPQYRVGSHRQFLLLARALAKAGYPVMRFDYRGMGDSTGDLRDFEAVNDDIAAGINAFRQQSPDIVKIVLWGLCDAASASLLYWDATRDQRVTGLVLLNPWVRSESSLARTHIKHYYGQRLIQVDFWRKLLSGRVGLGRSMGELIRNFLIARQSKSSAIVTEVAQPFQKKMARGLGSFSGSALLILSGNDYTAKEFLGSVASDPAWLSIFESRSISRIDLPGADHTFSTAQWRSDVERHTTVWLNDLAESL
jgi:uncharacterized protein